jgi:hypothetical protein
LIEWPSSQCMMKKMLINRKKESMTRKAEPTQHERRKELRQRNMKGTATEQWTRENEGDPQQRWKWRVEKTRSKLEEKKPDGMGRKVKKEEAVHGK